MIAKEPGGHHNMPWNLAAYAIELFNRIGRPVFGLNFGLSRSMDIAEDVYLGAPLLGDAVLRCAHLDIASILRPVECCRGDFYAVRHRSRNSRCRIKHDMPVFEMSGQ
jgi:hypothetical protein